MKFHHGRPDIEQLGRADQKEAAGRQAGRETEAPGEMIRRVMERINRDFYAAQPARRWLQDQRPLMMAVTWPATWLNERAIGLPIGRLEAIHGEILGTILKHGDLAKIKYFPAYYFDCIRKWFFHQGEALYEERKHIRNALDLRFLEGGRPAAPIGPDPIQALVAAHRVLASESRRSKVGKNDDSQPLLFDL